MAMCVETRQSMKSETELDEPSSQIVSRSARQSSIFQRLSRSSKYHVVKKTVNKAVLVGSDVYIPCLMKDPIGWLKGDYILYMDSMTMYDSVTYGEGKFKLNANPSRTRYSLLIRNIQFSDADSYFCQTGRGEKSKAVVTVIENPTCHRGRTKLREGDLTTFSCAVRLKGDLSADAQISWNKKEQILTKPTRITSGSGIDIVTSELKYRAKYEDNHESVNCFVTSPSWNDTTTPAPSCNAGNLDIFFEPRLICDDLQIFPDVPDGHYYVYCDVVANPIKNLNSIMWLISSGGQKKPIEDIENMTRKDIAIPNGYRSRVTVPYQFIKAKGNRLEFNVKMFYGGNTFSKSIKVRIHASMPSTFMALCITAAIIIALGTIGLIIVYYLHHQRMGEYDLAQRTNHDDLDATTQLANGRCNYPMEEENPESGDNIYDIVPNLKDSNDEPNNQRPLPEGQAKRKVRFKNNI